MELIKRRKAIESAFGLTSLSSDGINCAVHCPVCKEKKKNKLKLIIRLDDGRYQCWVCGTKGSNISYLVSKYKAPHAEIVYNVFGKSTKKFTALEEEPVLLPLSATFLLEKTHDPDKKAALKYVLSRGLSPKDIYRWRIMYSPEFKFRRRVIIPSLDISGNLNYYVARSIDESKKPKYMNSKISKNEIIFNEIDVNWKKPIVLVEGVFDAMKCRENTIPVLGSSLSKKSLLYQNLIRNSCKVTLSLDPDLKEKCYSLANDLARDGCNVSIAFAPEKTDLGALDKGLVKEIL